MANLQFFRVYNFIGIFSLSLSISLPQIYLSQLHDDLLSRVRVSRGTSPDMHQVQASTASQSLLTSSTTVDNENLTRNGQHRTFTGNEVSSQHASEKRDRYWTNALQAFDV